MGIEKIQPVKVITEHIVNYEQSPPTTEDISLFNIPLIIVSFSYR